MQRICVTFLKSELTELDALQALYKFLKCNFRITSQKHNAKHWIFSIEGHDAIIKIKKFKDDQIMKRILKNV